MDNGSARNLSHLPPIRILYENALYLVIDKPAGLVVNRAESVQEPTIQDWMESHPWYGAWKQQTSYTDEEQKIYLDRSGIVHRLDKDTTGAMVLAKDPATMFELMRQFRDRETEKTYKALVHGKFSVKNGTIKLPLSRGVSDRQRFVVSPDGRESETAYEVLAYYPGKPAELSQKESRSYQGFSLVRLHPKTGRTHQIRVHMSFLAHPLVGDVKYVGRKRARLDGKWCQRQFLHAEGLCFKHPQTKETVCYRSELPHDLQRVLEGLGEPAA